MFAIWLLAVFFLVALVFGVAGLSRAPSGRPTRSPTCARCHYDLTLNQSGHCPECGSALSGATILPPGSRLRMGLGMQFAYWTILTGFIGWTVGRAVVARHVIDPVVPTATTEISRLSLVTSSRGNVNVRVTATGFGERRSPRQIEVGGGPPGGVPANALVVSLPDFRIEENGKKLHLTHERFAKWVTSQERLQLTEDEADALWRMLEASRTRERLDQFIDRHSANSTAMGGAMMYYTGGSTTSTFALSPGHFMTTLMSAFWLAGVFSLCLEDWRLARAVGLR